MTGHDRASFAEGAKILSGIKTEATGVAHTTYLSTFVLRAVCLSGIFNNKESACSCKFQNRIHVRRLPEKVYRNDRFGSLRHALLQFRRVHRECVRVHIHKHGSSFAVSNSLNRRNKSIWDRDYFVAFTNSKRQESEPERICPIAHPDCIFGAAIGRELLFELFDERPAG